MELSPKAIFVGGIPRSGTRLMMNVLDRHREIAAFGETKLISHGILREFPECINRASSRYRPVLLELFKDLCLSRFYSYCAVEGVDPASVKLRNFFDGLWRHRFRSPDSLLFKTPLLYIFDAVWRRGQMKGEYPVEVNGTGNIPEGDTANFRGLFSVFSKADISGSFFILRELLDDISLEECYKVYGRFWNHVFTGYARKNNKLYWAEKTPTNVFYGSLLLRWFDGLKVINMVRDGRDVACSTMDRWPQYDYRSTLKSWAARLNRILEDQERMPQGSYINIRYEDLVRETESTVKRLSEFLEIGVDKKMLSGRISHSSIGRYKSSFPQELTTYAGDRYGAILEQWGYEL